MLLYTKQLEKQSVLISYGVTFINYVTTWTRQLVSLVHSAIVFSSFLNSSRALFHLTLDIDSMLWVAMATFDRLRSFKLLLNLYLETLSSSLFLTFA